MKISKLKSLILCSILSFTVILTGCLTSKQVTPATSTSPAVTNVVVNTVILTTDCAFIQTGLALGTSIAVQKDPSIVPVLTDVTTTLSGIINGASTNSATQVLALLGKNSNPTITANIAPIINSLSDFEQKLLGKYGSNNAVIIGTAIAKAANNGILSALPVTK